MDAILRPNRSLSPRAFKLMLTIVVALNVAAASVFIAQGAYPVAGFLGLDVAAIWLAFRLNYRAAAQEERLQLSKDCLYLERRGVNGASRHFTLNPIWAQVDQDEAGVIIRSGKAMLRVASFLSPEERGEFAAALRAALFRAKRGY